MGEEFAHQLAAAGLSLELIAHRAGKLSALAAKLAEQYPVKTKPVASDLLAPGGVEAVMAAADGRLVNNAGIAEHGSFFYGP